MTSLAGAGCADQSEQTGFRVRADFNAGLNADHGWAGALNENVTVFTDEPFRIRFEVVGSDELSHDQQFILQYRRNHGEWMNIEAEKFPKPEKMLSLDFELSEIGEMPEDWYIVFGNASGMKVAADESDRFLRVSAIEEPLMGLGIYETSWEVEEFTVELRLPDADQSGAGIIFGYVDSENYYRIYLDIAGALRLSRFVDGIETAVTEEKTAVAAGRWLEVEVHIEKDEVEIEFEDDLVNISITFDDDIPQSQIGFYVPANSIAEYREFELEGETSSPRVSILSCEAFENGAETTDLLAGSSIGFIAGAGINLYNKTIPWPGGNAQSEWEWPLVIRRFSDGALTNNEGDIFEFRMVKSNFEPLGSYKNPTLSLSVPIGHIGGTFVETPGRIGPFQASNGDLYFIIEPAETDNILMVIKSTDNGASWQEVDGENRPNEDDLEGFAAELSGHTIQMIHQQTNETWNHSFRISDHPTHPDTWDLRDLLITTQDGPPTQVATLALRSDGSIVAVYGGPRKLHYKIGSTDGVWGDDERIVDPDNDLILSDPQVVLGANDEVHFAYYGNNGTAWYRRILHDGSMTERVLLSTELVQDPNAKDGSILPLVYIPETNTLVVIYQDRNGILWERRITNNVLTGNPVQVSDRKVVHNAVDSDQAGADAIAQGRTVQVLFIEDETGSIYHTHTSETGNWQPSTLLVDGINGSWVRGSLYTRNDGVIVYGFAYDTGSGGGGGMIKYKELPLSGN